MAKDLFDLDAFDEECNRVRGHYVAALPSGVLSIHIKQVKKLDETQVTVSDPEVYVRVRVGKFIKCTRTSTMCKGRTIVDDIKHFSLTVSRKRDDPSNEMRIDLILVEGAHVHRIIGHTDMHLYDVIKNLYVAETYELKYRQHKIAEVELEACFAYGIFGFGYSHQLENRQKKLSDILGHSLLLRVEPPENRRQTNSGVMAPMPVGHPEIIDFAEEVEIGSATSYLAGKSGSTVDVFAGMEKHEPTILARTMRKRLHRIQTDFAQQGSRIHRKMFLEKLIMQHVEEQPVKVDQEQRQRGGTNDLSGTFQTGRTQLGGRTDSPVPTVSLLAVHTDTYGDDDDYATSADVTEIGNFLINAPGIVRRSAPRHIMPSVTTIPEDDNNDQMPSDTSRHASSLQFPNSTAQPEETVKTRRASTLTELSGTLVRGITGRLRAWRFLRARQTPEPKAPSVTLDGPPTTSTTHRDK